MKKAPSCLILLPLLLSCAPGGGASSSSSEKDSSFLEGYRLVWEDDFQGDSLDTSTWTYETGNNGGWGNQELEYYTDQNATVKDGILTIEARREEKNGYHFTSSRIKTAGKANITYGRVEARIKLSAGNALWPAFWMMPEANSGWPQSGEIDIMENKGSDPYSTSSAVHFLGGDRTHQYEAGSYSWSKRKGEIGIEGWHIYSLVWDEDGLSFYADEHLKLNVPRRAYHPKGGVYSGDGNEPFDKPFYVILNMAIGGNFDPGHSEPDADFESATMQVDYVRMYEFDTEANG